MGCDEYTPRYGLLDFYARRWMKRWPEMRDVLLFFGGSLGMAHETLWTKSPREVLIIAFMTMMGLPFFIRADHHEQKQLPPEEKDE